MIYYHKLFESDGFFLDDKHKKDYFIPFVIHASAPIVIIDPMRLNFCFLLQQYRIFLRTWLIRYMIAWMYLINKNCN